LSLAQPDPNRPQFTSAPLDGLWLANSTKWGLQFSKNPAVGLQHDDILVLNEAGFSCWIAKLIQPGGLPAHESQWFRWQFSVKEVGDDWGTSCLGKKVVTHQFRSPIDVRRTVQEFAENALLHGDLLGDSMLKAAGQKYLRLFQLRQERRVDIGYYELSIWPGKPKDRFVVNWNWERDLRLRSGSPRIEDDPSHPLKGWAVYEFKSGLSLMPDHSWKDEGFVLHLTLAYA